MAYMCSAFQWRCGSARRQLWRKQRLLRWPLNLRNEVRELIRSGKSDQEVKDFLVSRYGDFVLYRPEVKPLTWVLWFGPFVLLVIAAIFLGVYLRQRRALAAPSVMTDDERERAKQLLKG